MRNKFLYALSILEDLAGSLYWVEMINYHIDEDVYSLHAITLIEKFLKSVRNSLKDLHYLVFGDYPELEEVYKSELELMDVEQFFTLIGVLAREAENAYEDVILLLNKSEDVLIERLEYAYYTLEEAFYALYSVARNR